MSGLGLGLSRAKRFGAGFVPNQISGLELWLDSDYGVNAKTSADFVRANSETLSSASSDFTVADEDFSFGCWFKQTSGTGGQGLMGKYTSQLSYQISISGGTIYFTAYNGGATNVAYGGISAGTWYFVVCVHDSVNDLTKISINGAAFNTSAFSGGVASSSDDLVFGAYSGTNNLDGQIDGAFFTKEALSIATVGNLYNGGNGVDYATASTEFTALVDYWELNELSGNRDGELGHTLTDNNTVGSALGKIVEPVTNGDAVFQWLDKSVNLNHTSQSTFVNQPIYEVSPTAIFNTDGSGGQLLSVPSIGSQNPFSNGQTFIWSFVLEFSSFNAYNNIVSSATNTGGLNGFWFEFGTARGFVLVNDNGLRVSNPLAFYKTLSTDTKYLITIYRKSDNFVRVKFDSVEKSSDSYTSDMIWNGGGDLSFGAGDNTNVGNGFNGRYYESVFVNNPANSAIDSTINNLEKYLNNKYRIY
jgi:hypothetical protein